MSNPDTVFKPETLHDYFMGITKVAHPSANQPNVKGNEDPVRKYVIAQANNITNVKVRYYEPAATEPGKRVIVLSRPGSADCSNKKAVILQAHLDMVYNPADMEFPLNVIVDSSHTDGKWIKAQDKNNRPSTLGADDGIGVATALAILNDAALSKYPIECLFTVQEETDMGGAQNCDLGNLSGETLLNLDAEDLNVIIYGSAGGAETDCSRTITRLSSTGNNNTYFKVSISGLRGGHSGVDVNKGRLNAIKALTQVLVRLDKRINNLDVDGTIHSYDLLLCDIKRCDLIKSNAIPTYAEAIVAIPKGQADSFTEDFRSVCEALKTQVQPVESQFTYTAAETTETTTSAPLDQQSTDAVLGMLSQLASGVISMIPTVPDVVEVSSNLYTVGIENDTVSIALSNRSSNDAALGALNLIQKNIGNLFRFEVATGVDSYVSWQPDENSAILKIAQQVYNDAYPSQAKTTVIHAGLECGTLASRFRTEKHVALDCVSIGPTIRNPHTSNETLQIQSPDGTQTVAQFYECVSKIIQDLYK